MNWEDAIVIDASDNQKTTIGSFQFTTYGDCSIFHEPDAPWIFDPNAAMILQGLRAQLISEIVNLEILLNLPVAAHAQQGTHPFYQNVFEKFNELSDGTLGEKLDRFRVWMNKNNFSYRTLSESEFYDQASYIVEIRNGLLHYPFSALQEKTSKKYVPFVYSTKNKTTYILDVETLKDMLLSLRALKNELEKHKDQWFPIRTAVPLNGA